MSLVDSSNATVMNIICNNYRPNGAGQITATYSTNEAVVTQLSNDVATFTIAGVTFTLTLTSTGFSIYANSYLMNLSWGYVATP